MKRIAFIGLLIGMLALSACGASGGGSDKSGNAEQTAAAGTQGTQAATADPEPSASGEWTDAGGGESSSDAGSESGETANGGTASAAPQASAETGSSPSMTPAEPAGSAEAGGSAADQPGAGGGGTPKPFPSANPSPSSKPSPSAVPSASPSADPKGGGGGETSTEKPAGEEHVVEITNFSFSPSELEIRAGDTVKFVNRDEIKHTAIADDGESFDTGLLAQDESKTVTFDEEGEFGYHCAPHPGMKGTIVVKAD